MALLGGGFLLFFITVGVVWLLWKKWSKIPKFPEVLVGVFESFHFLFLFYILHCHMHISPEHENVFNPRAGPNPYFVCLLWDAFAVAVEEYSYNKPHTYCKVSGAFQYSVESPKLSFRVMIDIVVTITTFWRHASLLSTVIIQQHFKTFFYFLQFLGFAHKASKFMEILKWGGAGCNILVLLSFTVFISVYYGFLSFSSKIWQHE